jgi:subtilisin family serine protease
MKCALQSFLVVTLLLASLPAIAQGQGTETDNGHLVKASQAILKVTTSSAAILKEIKLLGDADDFRLLSQSLNLYVLHSKSANVAALVNTLHTHPAVQYVEPDYIVQPVVSPNDPDFPQQWSFLNTGMPGADIGATNAWAISTGSSGVVAGVVDTGIDYTHPDLAANVWSAPTSFTVTLSWGSLTCPAGSHGYNAITKSCDPKDDHGHGTHVSGTIGALGNNATGVAGVNWSTSLMALKFLDASGSGSVSDAIDAIEFGLQAKSTFGVGANLRVLSNSWGGSGFSQGLLDEINKANSADVLFVVAAGNSARNNDLIPSYPAAYNAPNIVTVAATTNTDALASFSNYGPTTVHLGAPGVNILSTFPGGTYATLSGTSMATPHVSGAALLLLSACNLSTAALKTTLLATVDPLVSLTGITITGGRLNVNKAIRSCSGNNQTTMPPSIRTAFGLTKIPVGGITNLSYTITNPNVAVALTGVGFVDNLPVGLMIANPNGLTGSCLGATTAAPGSTGVMLTGATLTVGASCTLSLDVIAVTDGVKNNFTGAVNSTEGGSGNIASASLTVASPPSLAIAFADPEIQLLGPGTALNFILTNPNTVTTLTGLTFNDTLPSGLIISTPNGLTGSCFGGNITANSGSNSISLSGATLGPGSSCMFSVNVTGIAIGVQANTTSMVNSNEALPGNAATSTTTVDSLFFKWFFVE